MNVRTVLVFLTILGFGMMRSDAQWRVRVKTLGGTPSAFSPPLNEPDDLRRLIGSNLADVKTVLLHKGTGWNGHIEDLERAAQLYKVESFILEPGKRIPWMAMRRRGRPTIYKPRSGMIWDGSGPLQGYSIQFASNHRAWRLIAPKACGNIWIVSEPLTQAIIDTISANTGANLLEQRPLSAEQVADAKRTLAAIEDARKKRLSLNR